MKNWPEQLYRLMPAVYQIRDGGQGEALRAVLHVVGEQVQQVDDDIERLYENWFIETCQDWAVPYIGDLVGFRRAGEAGEPGDAVTPRGRLLNRFLFPRREIANLVRRRRRKGTLSVLEDVSTDVTGWPARAVEFSRLIAFFQNVRHPQTTLGRTFDVRDRAAAVRVNTPFDSVAHTVDVRKIESQPGHGWYHPRKLGLFVWRRHVVSATEVMPCRVCEQFDKCHVQSFTFSRLGQDVPLYVLPAAETDELGIADEKNLPVPLYRHLLADSRDGGEWPRADETFYGLDAGQPKSLAIWVLRSPGKLELIPADRVFVHSLARKCDRRDAQHRLAQCQVKDTEYVVVDPECGRFLVSGDPQRCDLRVSFHYAATGDVGGGEYERELAPENTGRTVSVQAPATIPVVLPGMGGPAVASVVRVRAPSAYTGLALNPLYLAYAGQRKSRRCDGGTDDTLLPIRDCSKGEGPSSCGTDKCHPPKWCIQSDVCIEIIGSGTFEIPASQTLVICDGVTLEIRAASQSWPLIRLRSTDGNLCGNPWHVRLGAGSRLILDGLQFCGATMFVEDAEPPKSKEASSKTATSACDQPTQKQSKPSSCEPCPGDAESASTQGRGRPAELHIRHTTFVPGGHAADCSCKCKPQHASLTLAPQHARVCIQHSIVGTINVEHPRCPRGCPPTKTAPPCPIDPIKISIADSIVDAAHRLPAIYANCCAPAHADVTIARSTILGDVCVQQISIAEDSLFAGVVHVQRRGHGYMRFCFVPTRAEGLPVLHDGERCCRVVSAIRPIVSHEGDTSRADWCHVIRTPQRFKCVPDSLRSLGSSPPPGCCDAPAAGDPDTLLPAPSTAIHPRFVTTHYGQPGYCELEVDCPLPILRGAEDESEFGVFHDLYFPQRQSALEIRLQEYTPADMQSAVIYADDLHPTTFVRTHSDINSE